MCINSKKICKLTFNRKTCFRKYKEDSHFASEYKEEIYNQFKMKESLELTLPDKIVIGPFTIIVDPLKQYLINKRQELAQKLLDQFARKMSASVSEVLQKKILLAYAPL